MSNLDHLSLGHVKGKRKSGYLSWQRKRRHIHVKPVLDQLCNSVSEEQADVIMLTGDLVHIGLEEEIKEAKHWLESLGTPEQVMFVPGNHDVYAHDSWTHIRRYWSKYLPPSQDDPVCGYPVQRTCDGVDLIGLSTACVTPVFSARGAMGAAQRLRFKRMLENQNYENFRCWLIHHPPVSGLTKWRKALKDVSVMTQCVDQYSPDLIVYGHTHKNSELIRKVGGHDSYIYSTASASSSSSASYRIFDISPNGQGARIHMRLKCIKRPDNTDSIRFETVQEHRWRLQRN
jgi:3',5'-cyclic AMP phosphodiesterase CpdA